MCLGAPKSVYGYSGYNERFTSFKMEDPGPGFEEIDFRCSPCDEVFHGLQDFVRHYRNVNHAAPYQCAYCNIGVCEHFRSLVRHLKLTHPLGEHVFIAENDDVMDENEEQNADDAEMEDGEHVGDARDDGEVNEQEEDALVGPEALQDLCQAAAHCTLNLRQTPGTTTSAIQRFQVECNQMVQIATANNIFKVREFLTELEIDTPASRLLLQELQPPDPFQHIRTLKQQLNYFAKEFGMVKPLTRFLDYRNDYFLNPVTAQYEPVQVAMSFEYVTMIETLTSALNNPKIRNLIASETRSDDGVLRSYLDGYRSQTHSLVVRYPRIIRIQLYWDDVEVVNPLGSKTTIHKLAAFYFSIQNLPGVESAQLSSIYLLILAHSEDLKSPRGFQNVLAPFLLEMRKLESDQGVNIIVDGQPFVLRATLSVLVADTLAAHDILGLLGPGARCFCRKCLITRAQFHENCNGMGEMRTKAMFTEHVRQVSERPAFATECGVRRECPLHFTKEFDGMQDSVFDIFHDILEGCGQWDVSLALRTFIKYQKLFSVKDFNERIHAFNYGIMDIKNKPTPNFTDDSLRGKKLKQNGCQAWCLIRVFGFLVPEVPDDDPQLRLVNFMQKIMLITFSDKSRPRDCDELDALVERHNSLYQRLYMNDGQEVLEDDNDVAGGDDDDGDDEVDVVLVNNRRKVNAGNKMHHLKHYGGDMRRYGPLFKYWCARYEGRHKLFSQYGAVCCNFINPPKSMAQMHQMSTLAGHLNGTLRQEDMEVSGSIEVLVEATDHQVMLIASGLHAETEVEVVDSVKIAGDEYRPGNFVLTDAAQPTFAIIQRVYVRGKDVYFIVQPWSTLGFVDRFCAYEVIPVAVLAPLIRQHKDLGSHRSFAPWNPWKSRRTFIAPRTLIF